MNMTLPARREAVAVTRQRYEDARRAFLDNPTDEHRLALAPRAQDWADASDALAAALDEVRRGSAAAALA